MFELVKTSLLCLLEALGRVNSELDIAAETSKILSKKPLKFSK